MNLVRLRLHRAKILAGLLILEVIGVAVWFLAIREGHPFISLHCGLLPASNHMYLDGSGHVFQNVSWHLGNGTRTTGETYGIKLMRGYFSVQVRHVNPRVSADEAGD